MRQIRVSGKWVNGYPSEAGQRYRVSVGGDYVYGIYAPEFVAAEPSMKLTKQKFKLRFTPEERIAIRNAANQNPIVFDFMDLLESGRYADLKDPNMIAGVNAMEHLGLIPQGKAELILTTPPTEDEIFKE